VHLTARPLLVLVDGDPWRFVINSDSASFVLYQDGHVLYADRDDNGRETGEYWETQVGQEEMNGLLKLLPLVELDALRPRYEASHASDQRTHVLLHLIAGGVHAVSVYGPIDRSARSESGDAASSEASRSAHSDAGSEDIGADFVKNLEFARSGELGAGPRGQPAPEAFVAIYNRLTSFRAPQAHRWRPEQVEAMLLPMEAGQADSIPWPSDWPTFSSAKAKRPTSDHAGRIFLDGSQLKRAADLVQEEFKDQEKPKYISLEGACYGLLLRIPIPGEETWAQQLPSFH